ncbi:MAG: hypothetical protein Q8R33_16145 [Burkholderiales bacterium]|nr:hypothetical protein [Burkholderiales bacterium]
MVVAVLVELETPDVSPGVPLAVAPPEGVEPEPGAPMELVLPGVPVEPVVPAVLEVSLPAAGGAGVVVTLFSVVVLDVLDDVVGVAVSSRLVQAPRETAATSAKAAHEVRDALIRKLLEGLLSGRWKGRLAPPYCAL